MNREGNKITKRIVMAVLFIVAAVCIVAMMVYLSANRGSYDVSDMRDGWSVDYCGKHYDNVSRNDTRIENISSKKNDVLVMERRIDATGSDRLTVRIYSRLSSLRVSVVGRNGYEKEVYFYGYSELSGINTGDFLGSGYHFVELPQDSYGRTLKIMEMGSQDGALQGIPEVVVTPFNAAMPAFAQSRAFAAFVTIFMFLLGAMIILLSLFVSIFDRRFFTLTFLGLFSVTGGLWCVCSSKAVEIFSRNIRLNSTIEYISLYLLIIPILILVLTCFHNIPAWQTTVLFTSICAAVGLTCAAIVLQNLHLVNVDYVLPYFHVLLAIDALFLIFISAMHWKNSNLSERLFESGIFAAAISGVAYMVIYHVSSRAHLDSGILDLALVPAAFLLMTMLILVGYVEDLYERSGEQTQRERLFATSGNDPLTGLKDNIIGESGMRKLQLDGGDYLLISFDLNGLGAVNEEKGNQTGDLFIRTFADILKQVFPDADLLCRMGGDEFLVAYDRKVLSVQELDRRFDRVEAMEKKASDELSVKIEASFGYAMSTEAVDRDVKKAYQLANKRMFRMKTDMKNRRAGV